MATRLDKPWLPVAEVEQTLKGHLGVFELADQDGKVLYIGAAGGNSQYGLKGAVNDALSDLNLPSSTQFRVEITTSYYTRQRELLMAHVADFGVLPPLNPDIKLGKLSPA